MLQASKRNFLKSEDPEWYFIHWYYDLENSPFTLASDFFSSADAVRDRPHERYTFYFESCVVD